MNEEAVQLSCLAKYVAQKTESTEGLQTHKPCVLCSNDPITAILGDSRSGEQCHLLPSYSVNKLRKQYSWYNYLPHKASITNQTPT